METHDLEQSNTSVIVTRGAPKLHRAMTGPKHDEIVSRRALGQSISLIARELHITRNTVKRHLDTQSAADHLNHTKLSTLIPKAIAAIERCLDNGDGKLGMQLLERLNAIRPDTRENDSASLTLAINTLITTHPSSREGGPPDVSLKARGQNSPNSTPIIDVEPEEVP